LLFFFLLFFFLESFQRGKEKLREAGNRSDLSTDIDGLSEKKSRHCRAKKRLHSSSSSLPQSDDDDIVPLPKQPSRFEAKRKCKTVPSIETSIQSVSSGPSDSRSPGQDVRTLPLPNSIQKEIRPANITSPKGMFVVFLF
jgi:hypothetical protein